MKRILFLATLTCIAGQVQAMSTLKSRVATFVTNHKLPAAATVAVGGFAGYKYFANKPAKQQKTIMLFDEFDARQEMQLSKIKDEKTRETLRLYLKLYELPKEERANPFFKFDTNKPADKQL